MRMEQQETRQLAVVDRADPTRLVGLLTLSDIVRAGARRPNRRAGWARCRG
jgi:CBS domain-containing protein